MLNIFIHSFTSENSIRSTLDDRTGQIGKKQKREKKKNARLYICKQIKFIFCAYRWSHTLQTFLPPKPKCEKKIETKKKRHTHTFAYKGNDSLCLPFARWTCVTEYFWWAAAAKLCQSHNAMFFLLLLLSCRLRSHISHWPNDFITQTHTQPIVNVHAIKIMPKWWFLKHAHTRQFGFNWHWYTFINAKQINKRKTIIR